MGTTVVVGTGAFQASSTANRILRGSRGEHEGRETIICGHCGRGQYDRGQRNCIACHIALLIALEPLTGSDAPSEKLDCHAEGLRVCHRLRDLRGLLDVTQAELAAAAGSVRTYINKYENGCIVPSIHSLARLAGAFHLSLAELLDQVLSVKDLAALSLMREGAIIRALLENWQSFDPSQLNTLLHLARSLAETAP